MLLVLICFFSFTLKFTPMSEQEITLLRKENARLNRIIEALLTANEALRREISVLKTGNAPPEFGYSVAENSNGLTELGSSIAENSNGITGFGSSVAENSNGITEPGLSVVENGNGITGFGSSIAENSNGITEVLAPLPEKIEATSFFIYVVRDNLRTGAYAKAKDSGLESHAKMLIHFHNKGGGSHPELRKLTGLSRGGLSKSVTALTKRGLIVRDGFQRFVLTPQAKEFLKYCLTKNVNAWAK